MLPTLRASQQLNNSPCNRTISTPANADSEKTFSGKIVKTGGKLVLTTADKTTYQIDDQQKAQDFLNKSVKVTGVLDAATGTIRVSAIDPV